MKYRIEFSDDGAAFADDPQEVRRMMNRAATAIETLDLSDGDDYWLYDSNGNRVGSVRVL